MDASVLGFGLAFSIGVEMLNRQLQKKGQTMKLNAPHLPEKSPTALQRRRPVRRREGFCFAVGRVDPFAGMLRRAGFNGDFRGDRTP